MDIAWKQNPYGQNIARNWININEWTNSSADSKMCNDNEMMRKNDPVIEFFFPITVHVVDLWRQKDIIVFPFHNLDIFQLSHLYYKHHAADFCTPWSLLLSIAYRLHFLPEKSKQLGFLHQLEHFTTVKLARCPVGVLLYPCAVCISSSRPSPVHTLLHITSRNDVIIPNHPPHGACHWMTQPTTRPICMSV